MWVLQQVFAYPVAILQGETYVGGKSTKGRQGQGGVATDFLAHDISTNSFAVIEIKTPITPLVGNVYRGNKESIHSNDVYSMSGELTGAIVQAQNQVKVTIENFKNTLGEDFDFLNCSHPHSVVIIGNANKLNEKEKESFNLFRKSNKDLSIITFDELFFRIKSLKDLFID